MKRRDFLKLAGAAYRVAGCADRDALARPAWSSSAAASAAPPRRSTSACGTRRSTWCWSSATRPSSPARSRTWCSAATRACRRSAAATTACAAHGVQVVRDEVDARSTRRRKACASRAAATRLRPPDRLAGHRFHRSTKSQGYEAAMQAGSVLHAWKAGPQTVALRRQLEADARRRRLRAVHPAGAVPLPARARTSAPAWSRPTSSRRSRAPRCWCSTPTPTSPPRPACSSAAWSDLYPGIIEYRGNSSAVGVDGSARTVKLEFDDVKGDVLNVVPPHRAGDIARRPA